VTSAFFDVMDIPLLDGRSFSQTDAASEPTVVISRALADRLWKGRNAVGRFVEGEQMDKPARVVGVAGDARYVSVWESRPMVYHRVDVNDHLANTVLLRTTVPPSTLSQSVGRAWRAMSPDLRVSTVRVGDDYVRLATDSQRLASRLFSVFSLVALTVASIGLYSAMAWIVERRRREIAIRMAIGGSPGTIASRVVLQAGVVAIGGTSLGLGAAAALAPQLAAMSRHTTPYDPVAFGATAAALALVCLVAAVIPAVRASRVDPALVLRGD
jgi:putative ABC transport system permease protein